MRVLLFIVATSLSAWLASSSPIDPHHQLVNKPTPDMVFRPSRSAERSEQQRRPYDAKVKDVHRLPLGLNLRKGEYICGDKVCKLQPGQIPDGCEGRICQYPIL